MVGPGCFNFRPKPLRVGLRSRRPVFAGSRLAPSAGARVFESFGSNGARWFRLGLRQAMDAGLSVKPPLTRTGRKTSSRAKDVVFEKREKSVTETWSDGEDCDVEEVRKQEAVPAAPRNKGHRSERKFTSVEDVDAEIARLKAPPCVLTQEDFQLEYKLPMRGITLTDFARTLFVLKRCRGCLVRDMVKRGGLAFAG